MPEKKPPLGKYLSRYRLAAPSWVIPGSLNENCRFLASKVDEVGLLFMETEACLQYGPEDLPASLADLPLSYHVHLPVDLPMRDGPATAAAICYALLKKTAFLAEAGSVIQGEKMPHLRAVLHPPVEDPAQPGKAAEQLDTFVRAFADMGGNPSLLLLENIRGNNLLRHFDLLRTHRMGICLDLGHALAFGQDDLLEERSLPGLLGMVHLSAPGKGASAGRHMPLTTLNREESAKGTRLCSMLPHGKVIVLELFDWTQVRDSLPLLLSWLGAVSK